MKRIIPSPIPDASPLRIPAFCAGISNLLYLSDSFFSPQNAVTVLIPPIKLYISFFSQHKSGNKLDS